MKPPRDGVTTKTVVQIYAEFVRGHAIPKLYAGGLLLHRGLTVNDTFEILGSLVWTDVSTT